MGLRRGGHARATFGFRRRPPKRVGRRFRGRAPATNAPSGEELEKLILDVGPQGVMRGTDFAWYDLADTANRVMDLPLLSSEQKSQMLGANAARILRLPVTKRAEAR